MNPERVRADQLGDGAVLPLLGLQISISLNLDNSKLRTLIRLRSLGSRRTDWH
jgi:hypothetical protein